MKKLFPLPMILCAAACSHTQPAVEVRTVEVPVIRVEHCLAAADVPRKPSALPKRPATMRAALDIAFAKVLELTSYAEKADALLQGCAAKP